MRTLDVDAFSLQSFRLYNGKKDRQKLLCWQIKEGVTRDTAEILRYMTIHKFLRYIQAQYAVLKLRRTPGGTMRYRCMQDLVSEYRDYLELCDKLCYDRKNSFVLYPKDLQKAHDKASRRLKKKEDAILKRKFSRVYQEVSTKLCLEAEGLKIVCPKVPEDLLAEGNQLHHCVGSYIERVAKGECLILFLRQCDKETKPYYTIEVRGTHIVQVRGMGNCTQTPEVQKFLTLWEKKRLRVLSVAA